jgi:hypothetical protein
MRTATIIVNTLVYGFVGLCAVVALAGLTEQSIPIALLSVLAGIPLGAIMLGLLCLAYKKFGAFASNRLAKYEDPQEAMYAAMRLLMLPYFAFLFLPAIVLWPLKQMVPDCSITVTWLVSMAVTVIGGNILHRKGTLDRHHPSDPSEGDRGSDRPNGDSGSCHQQDELCTRQAEEEVLSKTAEHVCRRN